MRRNIAEIFLILTVINTSALGQARPPQEDVRVTISTAEVLLDTVVRDKRGRVVRDLTDADFEVYEDGVRQQLKESRFVTRQTATEDAKVAEADQATPFTKTQGGSTIGLSAFALVFDRLKPESRNNARQAAMAYANKNLRPQDIVGVFAIDQSLNTVQSFTSDAQLVRKAVDRASSMNSSMYNLGVEMNRVASRGSLAEVAFGGQSGIDREGPVSAASASPTGPGGEASVIASIVSLMNSRSREVFERLEREQQGYATSNSLLAVAEALRAIPGRKAIIFFSEGVAIPDAVQAHFRSVINTANHAGVSVYTVDAAGLRAESATAETRRQINALSGKLADRGNSSGEDTSGQPLTKDLERNEDLLRFNPHSGLGQLADQTGGFLIRDTNDLNDGLRRIDEDMGAYYLLSYTPQNQNYDGRFRQVEVKLKRAGLSAQSRKGYYAINGSFASPVLTYEAPALAIAAANNRPHDLVVRSAAFDFPKANGLNAVPVVAEVPACFVSFAVDKAGKQYSTNFSIVALIKDEKQQIVRKLSSQYLLSGPADKLEAARQGEVLFYRETELEPGRYTVETVVHDALGNKAGFHQNSLEVPDSSGANKDEGLLLSSVVVINRVEQLKAADKNPHNPFQFGEVLVYPNLGAPLSKSATKRLGIFFTAQALKGDNSAPKMLLEISTADRSLAQIKSDLPAPDASGRLQHASAIPLDSFQPGTYDLKITITHGNASVTRAARFVVRP